MRFPDEEQRSQVGFDFVMERLNVHTPYGLDEKKGMKPFSNKEMLLRELVSVKSLVDSMKHDISPYEEMKRILVKIKDIRGSLTRCGQFQVLDDVELYEIKYFCLLLKELIPLMQKVNLEIADIKMYPLDDVISLLDPEGKMLPTFHVYESYSERLKSIRSEKRALEDSIRREKDEDRIKELKRKRLDLVVLEEEEELDTRKVLSNNISEHLGKFEENIKSLGRLDYLAAKAKLALEYGLAMPVIVDEMEICIEGMVNPEIADILLKKGKSFTPVSIRLGSGTTVITGANMGGKSVALKTLALNLLLGQMGFFMFCKKADLPVLDFLFLISDDMQSVLRGLSTFGAEIIKLKEALENIDGKNGFLALDEFARGTNPAEGRYLVKSLCQYLMGFKSISVISTHYDGVVEEGMVHYQVTGLKNTDFDELERKISADKSHSVEIIQEHMDYSLERVQVRSGVPRDALNICGLLGLDEDITGIARKLYNEDENI